MVEIWFIQAMWITKYTFHGVANITELEMLLIPNALCWSPRKCNCACALPTEVQLRLRITRRSWQKLFAGKNFVNILVTAQTQLRSFSEQRAFGNSNICNWPENWDGQRVLSDNRSFFPEKSLHFSSLMTFQDILQICKKPHVRNIGSLQNRTFSGFTHRYTREIPEPAPILSWHGDQIGSLWVFSLIKITVVLWVCMPPGSTVVWGWRLTYLKRRTAREDHGRICFSFVSACMVGKYPKTSNLSLRPDDTITRGGIHNLGFPLYICGFAVNPTSNLLYPKLPVQCPHFQYPRLMWLHPARGFWDCVPMPWRWLLSASVHLITVHLSLLPRSHIPTCKANSLNYCVT